LKPPYRYTNHQLYSSFLSRTPPAAQVNSLWSLQFLVLLHCIACVHIIKQTHSQQTAPPLVAHRHQKGSSSSRGCCHVFAAGLPPCSVRVSVAETKPLPLAPLNAPPAHRNENSKARSTTVFPPPFKNLPRPLLPRCCAGFKSVLVNTRLFPRLVQYRLSLPAGQRMTATTNATDDWPRTCPSHGLPAAAEPAGCLYLSIYLPVHLGLLPPRSCNRFSAKTATRSSFSICFRPNQL
jgi:hypothetical protein